MAQHWKAVHIRDIASWLSALPSPPSSQDRPLSEELPKQKQKYTAKELQKNNSEEESLQNGKRKRPAAVCQSRKRQVLRQQTLGAEDMALQQTPTRRSARTIGALERAEEEGGGEDVLVVQSGIPNVDIDHTPRPSLRLSRPSRSDRSVPSSRSTRSVRSETSVSTRSESSSRKSSPTKMASMTGFVLGQDYLIYSATDIDCVDENHDLFGLKSLLDHVLDVVDGNGIIPLSLQVFIAQELLCLFLPQSNPWLTLLLALLSGQRAL